MKKRKTTKNNEIMPGCTTKEVQDTLMEIIVLTDEFCAEYLNEEYLQLCSDMAVELVGLGVAIDRGKPAGWASGIVHAVGYVNFLNDPSQSPHMTSAEVAKGFGVSLGTMQAKSKIIRDELDLMPFDPDWCLESLVEDNPLIWMLEVNGLVMDIRMAPREAQEEAYRMGLIPYIPANRKKPESKPDLATRIIQFPSGRAGSASSKHSGKARDESPPLFD